MNLLQRIQPRCPLDGGALTVSASVDVAVCASCHRRFAIEQGVLRLTDADDPFYEGVYLNHVAWTPIVDAPPFVWPLWLINSGYPGRVRHRVPAGKTVLEIGPGAGVAYFGRRYDVIGLDVSFRSLALARKVYGACMQADIRRGIPLPNASIDAIVSSFFWEHMMPADKERIAAECYRVLTPGGMLLFLCDVATCNSLIQKLRQRDDALYRQEFLARDGHVGYETIEQNCAHFGRAGFELLAARSLERTWLQANSVYEKMRRWPGWPSAFGRALFPMTNGRMTRAWLAIVRMVDATIGHAWPRDNGRIALFECRKPTAHDR
jgi:SAM-dependent methyltransferase